MLKIATLQRMLMPQNLWETGSALHAALLHQAALRWQVPCRIWASLSQWMQTVWAWESLTRRLETLFRQSAGAESQSRSNAFRTLAITQRNA